MESAAPATKVCASCGGHYAEDALFCPADGAPLQSSKGAPRGGDGPDPYLAREISGHIQVKQLAGVGAMGRVYRAYQTGVDRDVAVKILHRELSANPQLVARFTREAKVASRLQHPNAVQVHLAGQLDDGALYMVMEFLDGMSLQSALAAAGGAMPLGRALHVGLQLCDAVGEAHAQGIVHRDLKPENVMLVRRGDDHDFVKVLDFGIARINWGEQSMATAAGLVFGTARYISPEGAQGEAVNPPGDVYSIATLLYQMLAGRTPFESDQPVQLLLQQIHQEPPELRSLPGGAGVPAPISDVVMKGLAKAPSARFADARAFGRALADAALHAGLSSEDLGPMVGLAGRGSLRRAELASELERAASSAPRAVAVTEVPQSPPAPGSATVRWSPQLGPALDDTLDDHPGTSAPPPTALSPARRDASGPIVSPPESAPRVVLEDEPAPAPPRRPGRGSLAALVLGCFAVGVLLAIGVAYKLGRIGPDRDLEAEVARAQAALMAHRLYEPPGDNVREVTARGLARWPREPRFLEARERACDELVSLARIERSPPEALRVAKIALELDPSDPSAKRLVEDLEGELAKLGAIDPVAPLPSVAAPLPAASGVAGPRAATSLATLDVTPAQPRVGQAVALVARVSPRAKTSDAAFTISGATLAPVRMDPLVGPPGTYRGRFTFLEGGAYTVTFTATVDGAPARAERAVVTQAPVPDPGLAPTLIPPSLPSAPTLPLPLPSASARWL